jgi:hypothetical protein
MPLSDRVKGLLDWWQLRIETNRNKSEETKENVESNDPSPDISSSDSVGDNINERGEVK